MASITKKGENTWYVIHKDPSGIKPQIWTKAGTHEEALRLKAKIEHELNEGVYIPPLKLTLDEYFKDFVELYGEQKWGPTTYQSNIGLYNNYISKLLGSYKLQNINSMTVDKFYKKLQKTKPVDTKLRKARTEFVTPYTIEKIHKLLLTIFQQAVKWDRISKNPFENAILPKHKPNKRKSLTAEEIMLLLEHCNEPRLYIAINMSFACSTRSGEACGLTWDDVFVSDEDIIKDNARISISKTLERVSVEAMKKLDNKEVIRIFPTTVKKKATTRLVLKSPKTDSSIRIVYIPKQLAYILRDHKKKQAKMKQTIGADFYHDYNLVIAHEDGRPVETRFISKHFNKLISQCGLSNDYVFHSLRHSSITYKLLLNNCDIKATQSDSGHATAAMVLDHYSHALEENRKVNAQKFNDAFYSNNNLQDTTSSISHDPQKEKLNQLLTKLDDSPELLDLLLKLADINTDSK